MAYTIAGEQQFPSPSDRNHAVAAIETEFQKYTGLMTGGTTPVATMENWYGLSISYTGENTDGAMEAFQIFVVDTCNANGADNGYLSLYISS